MVSYVYHVFIKKKKKHRYISRQYFEMQYSVGLLNYKSDHKRDYLVVWKIYMLLQYEQDLNEYLK